MVSRKKTKMCIVDGPIESLRGTKIFVGELSNNRQLTVYKNEVKLPWANGSISRTAMILPFVKGKIQLINFENHKNVFSDLNKYFATLSTNSFESDRGVYKSLNSISIQKLGSYDVSIVPSYDDFDRLRFDHFNLSSGVKQLFERDYRHSFGFLVCKLRENGDYHPMGYVTNMMPNGQLFVPTKHYHNGSEEHADWDHEVYVYSNKMETNLPFKPEVYGNKFYPIGLEAFKKIFPFTCNNEFPSEPLNLQRYTITNYKYNHDILVS
jgi:hypothetical protein